MARASSATPGAAASALAGLEGCDWRVSAARRGVTSSDEGKRACRKVFSTVGFGHRAL